MIIQESLENVDEEYIKELYSTLALQYLIFRYNIKNEFEADNTLASAITDNVLNPRIIDTLKAATEDEFNIVDERIPASPAAERYATLTPDDRLILKALEIALESSDVMTASGEEDFEHPYVPEPDPVPELEEPPEPETEETAKQDDEPIKENATEKHAPQKVKPRVKNTVREPIRIAAKVAEPKPAREPIRIAAKVAEPKPAREPVKVSVKLKEDGDSQ